MKLITYVNFAGKWAEAFHYYEQHLGAKVVMIMTHGQNPAPSPYATGDWKDAVLHARLTLGGTELAGADVPKAEPMQSAYLTLNTETDSEAERIFSAPSDGGQVLMPMQETFFASRFAQVRDRFGVNVIVSGLTG
jgi:PhnB protein